MKLTTKATSPYIPSFLVMMASMFSSILNFKITESIVRPFTILMVNYLIRLKSSFKILLNNMSMLSNSFSINNDYFITFCKRTSSSAPSNLKVWVSVVSPYNIMSYTKTFRLSRSFINTISNRTRFLFNKFTFVIARLTTVLLRSTAMIEDSFTEFTFVFHNVLITIIDYRGNYVKRI